MGFKPIGIGKQDNTETISKKELKEVLHMEEFSNSRIETLLVEKI